MTSNSWSQKWCESDNNINDVSHSNLLANLASTSAAVFLYETIYRRRITLFLFLAFRVTTIGHRTWMDEPWVVVEYCLCAFSFGTYLSNDLTSVIVYFFQDFSFCCWRRPIATQFTNENTIWNSIYFAIWLNSIQFNVNLVWNCSHTVASRCCCCYYCCWRFESLHRPFSELPCKQNWMVSLVFA